ncbi:hypothetical protein [Azospirillum sp. BE72]|uniref:hypothetical protein n=1 Tax=Azospirillum sp. BE72 TaxID=2817776 RepID=UPI0028613F2F|nr:hypothetical protein [Azospirillum sp. BE72]MDR6775727.1 hypothetical protein [Azospirillum sp. BE72]
MSAMNLGLWRAGTSDAQCLAALNTLHDSVYSSGENPDVEWLISKLSELYSVLEMAIANRARAVSPILLHALGQWQALLNSSDAVIWRHNTVIDSTINGILGDIDYLIWLIASIPQPK